jgi:predicted RNase H-like HicB family nuclease
VPLKNKMNMEKLIINLGAGSNHFGAYAENCEGIYGAGDTVQETKDNVLEGLRLFVKYNENNLPDILKGEYEVEWKFDVASFLKYYANIFSKPALERITGINQKQLFHYASGKSKPTEKTVKKIDSAFRRFTSELSQVHFV